MPLHRVLVTGAHGQVGTELLRAQWPEGTVVRGLTRSELDITNQKEVEQVVHDWQPDLVINAAAYTAVDQAEDEPGRADSVNHEGVGFLCHAASEVGASVLHLSTDYVFDGKADSWYCEQDDPSPLGVYGSSKRKGELAALAYPRNVVVRTSWVYSVHRSNFVLTMRRLAKAGMPIKVVADQWGCPTSAQDLARGLVAAVSQGLTWPGLFHLAAPDEATWFSLAEEAIGQMGGVDQVDLTPIGADEYPTAAVRPVNSRLSSARFNESYGIALLPWRKALAAVTAELDSLELDGSIAPGSKVALSGASTSEAK